jgi:hypothetical protein
MKQSLQILLPAIDIQVAAGGTYIHHSSFNSLVSSYGMSMPSSMAMLATNDNFGLAFVRAIKFAANIVMLSHFGV